MKMIQVAAIAAAGVVLVGCKTEFAAEIPLSTLQDSSIAAIPALARLEVLSCDHYEDSRQPSDALVKAQEMMPRIFPSAEFSECYQQGMDSWAEFHIALPIDRDNDPETFASEDAFNLTTTEDLPLGLAVPPALLQRLEEAQRANVMMGTPEYAISLKVVNDTDDVFSPTVLAAWANDHPLTLQGVDLSPGEEMLFTLSDVLIDRAMKNGEASVLIDFERLLAKRDS